MAAEFWMSLAALFTSIISIIISYYVERRNLVSDKQPVIIFEFDENSGWKARNIGKGPALNLDISVRGRQTNWLHSVSVPPLREESEFRLHWIGKKQVWMIGATYSDFESRKYTTIGQHNRHRIESGHNFENYHEHHKDYLIGSNSLRHWNIELLDDPSLI